MRDVAVIVPLVVNDVRSGRAVAVLGGAGRGVLALDASPDGHTVAASSRLKLKSADISSTSGVKVKQASVINVYEGNRHPLS